MNIKEYIAWKLNEEQAKAAFHTDTNSIILAGAGSGKTRVLTYKIAYLIKGLGCPVQRILGVTFTNKAATEMKDRLVKIFEELDEKGIKGYEEEEGEEKTGDDVMDFIAEMNATEKKVRKEIKATDLKRIGTFHSIFLKVLKEDIEKLWMKYTKEFTILDTKDRDSIFKELIKKHGLKDNKDFKESVVAGFIGKQKNAGLSPKDFMKESSNDYEGTMGKLYEEYEKVKEISNALDFDDLLLLPLLLFKKNPEVLQKWQNKFDYILVDEAQDTNGVQFTLMDLLSQWGAPITYIGDDFQSIYRRRWAVVENFIKLSKSKMFEEFKLQMNYRSKSYIVKAGNEIIKNNRNQTEKTSIAFREGEEKIKSFIHPSDTDEAANIVELIKKLKEKGKIWSLWDIAILYRKNSQSPVFEKIFIQEKIPYIIYGGFKFFERKEIKDITAYLTFLLNTRDTYALKRILNVPNRKIGDTTLWKIMDYANNHEISLYETIQLMWKWEIPTSDLKITSAALEGVKRFILLTEELKKELEQAEIATFIETLIKKLHYKEHLIDEEKGNEEEAMERYENVGQLINMAKNTLDKGKEWLEQFMNEIALMSDDAGNDEKIEKVQLMTIHKSKGLEFPIVFLVGLEDGVFPGNQASCDPEELAEERRLMYVAVTRAQDVLFFSRAESRMEFWQEKYYPESRFIREISSDAMQEIPLNGNSNPFSSVGSNTSFSEGDRIIHKFFGTGTILEIWENFAVVQFDNPKFWPRKTETRFLEKM